MVEDPNSAMVFTVTRSGDTSQSLTVQLNLSGTANLPGDANYDYTLAGTSLTQSGSLATVVIGAGSSSATFTLTPHDDALAEGNETATILIASDAAYQIGSASIATVTIEDDDLANLPTVSLFGGGPLVEDPNSAMVFTVTRSGDTSQSLTVHLNLSGTANLPGDANYDYTLAGTSLTQSGSLATVVIGAGSSSATFTLTPHDDALAEGSETATVLLAFNGTYQIDNASMATVTIYDNEVANLPMVSLAADSSWVDEGSSSVVSYTVARSGDTTQSLTVQLNLSGTANLPDDANYDYTLAGTSLTQSGSLATVVIGAGSSSATFTLTPHDDALVEASETATILIASSGGYQIGSASMATVTIHDNDGVSLATVNLTADSSWVDEGSSSVVSYTVARSGDTTQSLTVQLNLSGTANLPDDANYDYTLAGTSLTQSGSLATVVIGAGSSSATFTLTPHDDALVEASETVTVLLASDTAYQIGSASTTFAIVGDNDPPTVSIWSSDSDASEEGLNPGHFTVHRNGDTSQTLTVQLNLSGTANLPGDANYDYTLAGTSIFPSGSFANVYIDAGSSSATFTLTPRDDTLVEGSETATILIASSGGYQIGSASMVTVTISDNDVVSVPTVSLTADSSWVDENSSSVVSYTVTRSGDTSQSLTVQLNLSGTANLPDDTNYDYTLAGTSITQSGSLATVVIGAGSSSATFTLIPRADALDEASESATVQLASDTAYQIGSASIATVTIGDNDLPTVSIWSNDGEASEEGLDPGCFTVSRDGDTTVDLTVFIEISSSSTATADDYSFNYLVNPILAESRIEVTIFAGHSSAIFKVTPSNDNKHEAGETVILTLTDDPGQSESTYNVDVSSTATMTIADNDLPWVTITASDPVAMEPVDEADESNSLNYGEFTVTRESENLSDSLTVHYSINGSAGDEYDYRDEMGISLSGYVTIAAGETTATIKIVPQHDTELEVDKNVGLAIIDDPNQTEPTYSFNSSSTATVTTHDSEPEVTISVAPSFISESDSSGRAQFTLSRSGSTSDSLTVSLTLDGWAQNGIDYNFSDITFAPDGMSETVIATVTIPEGSAFTEFYLSPSDDDLAEGDEDVVVSVLGSSGVAVVTIDDNEPNVTISAYPTQIDEDSNNVVTYTLIHDGPWGQSVTAVLKLLDNNTASNTVDYDFSGANFTQIGAFGNRHEAEITFPEYASYATFTLSAIEDDIHEGNEDVVISTRIIGSPSTATVTIVDGDPIPAATILGPSSSVPGIIPDGTVMEGDLARMSIQLAGPMSHDIVLRVEVIPASATSGEDFDPLDVLLTIEQGETQVEFDIQTLVDRDDATDEVVDVNEAIEYFDVRVSLNGVTLTTNTVNIDDDFTVVDEWGERQVLVRTSAAGPFVGGFNPLNDDSLYSEDWHTGEELPLNGTILYLDDWVPLISVFSESGSLFYNPVYNAGVRQGSIMVHAGKKYYFTDLQMTADNNDVGSKEEFETFLKHAKERYEIDQLMIALKKALYTQNNPTHRELLRLIDAQYFKTGESNLFSGDSFGAAKELADNLTDVREVMNDFLENIGEDNLDDIAISFREAQLVTTELVGTITTTKITQTIAIQLNYEYVVIARGDGTYAVFGSQEYQQLVATTTEIQVDQVLWKRPDEINVPQIPAFNLATIVGALDTANTALTVIGSSLDILQGMWSDDLIEGLDVLEGIFNLGAEWAPPGISKVFEMYAEMVNLSQELLGQINFEQSKRNIQRLIDKASRPGIDIHAGGQKGLDSIYLIQLLQGDAQTLLSDDWLEANSDFFDHLLQ